MKTTRRQANRAAAVATNEASRARCAIGADIATTFLAASTTRSLTETEIVALGCNSDEAISGFADAFLKAGGTITRG